MQSIRRDYLDRYLDDNVSGFSGVVVDIGGFPKGRRGKFSPQSYAKIKWLFVNIDPDSGADIVASASEIPLEDSSCDHIVCTEVFEYLDNPHSAVLEMRRILKPGGTGILSMPFLHAVHGDKEKDRLRYTRLGLQELFDSAHMKIKVFEMGSLFSVFFDLGMVAFGYASAGRFYHKVARKVFGALKPLAKILDRALKKQSIFITTGYFIIFEKEKS